MFMASRPRHQYRRTQLSRPQHKRRLFLETLENRSLMAVVSHWTADNTTVDSVSANNGTLFNGAGYLAGQVGQAFSFDGVNDRINVADSPSLKLTQSLSIEAWIRVDGFPTSGGVVLFRGDDRGGLDPYQLATTPDGTIKFLINSLTQGVSVQAPVPLGQFVHVAGTLDDATGAMKLYLNGALVAQLVTPIRPFGDLDPASNPGVGIGNHGGYPTTPHNFPFNGRIDDLKLYNHALTGAEVLADFNAAKGPTTISVSDASAIEGSSALKILDRFVNAGSGGLSRPRTPLFGPDGNGDGAQDLYVASADGNEILRFDGTSGDFLDSFVTVNSGGLLSPGDIVFGPDGNLYVSSLGNLPGTPAPPGGGSVLRYNGSTGAFIDAVATGLSGPLGMVFGPDGSLYTAEQSTDQVLRTSGGVTSVFVSAGNGGLDLPRNVLFGPDANGDSLSDLYVSSNLYDGILRYDGQTGAFIDKFASTGIAKGPAWMEFAPDGTLYATTATTTCCDQTFVRFNATTGAKIDTFDTGRDGWSFKFGPDGLIYNSGNGGGNFVDRVGPSSLLAFTVNLNYPSDVPITVDYSVFGVSATAGVDFTAASGTITFAPGQTTRGILVPTLNDASIEPNETLVVTLSNPVGAAIADGTGVGTISDDDTKFYVVDDATANKTFEYGSGPGAAGENYALNPGNTAPRGAASTAAGDKVWVVDANKNVYVYDTSGGLVGSWAAGGLNAAAQVEGIATNGTDVWIVDAKQDKVFLYTGAASRLAGSQNAASSFALNKSDTNPKDIVVGGTSLWVVDDGSTDKVYKYNLSGSLLGSWTITGAGSSPTGITLDPSSPSHLWIVDSGTDRVYQFDNAVSRTSGSQSPSTSFALAAGNTNPQGIADPPAPAPASSSFDYALLGILDELEGVLVGKKRK